MFQFPNSSISHFRALVLLCIDPYSLGEETDNETRG
jgi:hypothetical protein